MVVHHYTVNLHTLPTAAFTCVGIEDALYIVVVGIVTCHCSEADNSFLVDLSVGVGHGVSYHLTSVVVLIGTSLQRHFLPDGIALGCTAIAGEDKGTVARGTDFHLHGIGSVGQTDDLLLSIEVQSATCAVVRVEVACAVLSVVLSACGVLVASTLDESPASLRLGLRILDECSVVSCIRVLVIQLLLVGIVHHCLQLINELVHLLGSAHLA